MKPGGNYSPEDTAAYSVDEEAIRCILAIAAAHRKHVCYFDIPLAFTTEAYDDSKEVLVKHIRRFDRSYTCPNKLVGKLQKTPVWV